jgi:hypothetical protein
MPVHVKVAKDFADAGGSEFYTKPDLRNPLFANIVQAAQAYSDMVATAFAADGWTVYRLVLSANVHKCYGLVGCVLLVYLRRKFV